MSQLEQWFEQTFKPWKKEMDAYRAGKAKQIEKLKQHSHVMQKVVADVLEGKTSEAVRVWNGLGLEPALADIKLDYKTDSVIFRSKGGKAVTLKVDDLLQELDTLM